MDGLFGFFDEVNRIFQSLARGSHRSVFVGFDPIIESEVPEKSEPSSLTVQPLMDAKLS